MVVGLSKISSFTCGMPLAKVALRTFLAVLFTANADRSFWSAHVMRRAHAEIWARPILYHASVRQEKRARRLPFWVRRPPGGVGVFHSKGWWPKTSCPPSKVCLPWVSKGGIWDVPGFLSGCPGPLGVFKKFEQKKFVRIFRSLKCEPTPP